MVRADLLDDDRGQSFGRLVEQKKPRAGAQDAADRQHLLLAAGELGALAREPFAQVREQLENAVERQAAGPHLRRQQQIFLRRRGSRRCRVPPGQKAMPGARDRIGRKADQFLALEAHRAGAAARSCP